MRFIKLIAISIISLFLLITIFSLFIPSRVIISRAIDIKASPVNVMPLISESENWKYWYPGADTMKTFYRDRMPKGYVLQQDPPQYIEIDDRQMGYVMARIHRGKKNDIISTWELITSPQQTTVHWSLRFELSRWPWHKFSSLFFDKVYGSQLQEGLTRLKSAAEVRVMQEN